MKFRLINLTAFLAICASASFFYSCVPARQFEDLQKKDKTCQDENTKLKSDNQDLQTENTELKSSSSEMQKKITTLARDTSEMGMAYQRLTNLYKELNTSYDKLLSNNEKLLAGSTEETRKLIIELNTAREALQKKEDHIKSDSLALNEREIKLNELRDGLKAKQARVDELEAILRSTDSTATQLKNSVNNALLGYKDSGLSVYQKEGRVYVSMEERLLFASGSTIIEKQGADALKDLSKVLSQNKTINIMVEGHTDNVPINGTLPSGAKDNWELSVLRATSIAKIILNDKAIDPTRITASGRGPYKPVDPANTAEARKKNRRTEIVLSPKYDELVKLLDQFGKK